MCAPFLLQRSIPSTIYFNISVQPGKLPKYSGFVSLLFINTKKSNNQVARAPGGRICKILDTKKRLIQRKIIHDEQLTAVQAHHYPLQENYEFSYGNVFWILRPMDFAAQIKKKKPLLSNRYQIERYRWAKNRQSWTVDKWSKAIFRDQTKVNVWGSDDIKFCCKRPGVLCSLTTLILP
jgi:hypothetical protein